MKKFFTIFFVTLGVIFFGIILAAITFFIVDPYNIRPFLFPEKQTPRNVITIPRQTNQTSGASDTETNSDGSSTTTEDAPVPSTPSLSPAQVKALETVGIDPDVIQTITPEQEACFIDALGAARVNEIKAGDTPTPTEFLKAQSCI